MGRLPKAMKWVFGTVFVLIIALVLQRRQPAEPAVPPSAKITSPLKDALQIRPAKWNKKQSQLPPTGGAAESRPDGSIGKSEFPDSSYERQHLERVLKAVALIQKTPSFPQRVRIYCRSQAVAFPVLPWLGSVEDLEIDYARFVRDEPATQEEEIKRQGKLRAWTERLAQAHTNMNGCIGEFSNGSRVFPTSEQEGEFAEIVRARIRDIDHPSTASTQPKPAPKQPDHEPIILYKVEPEFSEQARRAHWNGGDIDVAFTIDESGKASNMKVLNSPGMGLDEKVISALEKWRFSPKIQDGVPVASSAKVRMSFKHL